MRNLVTGGAGFLGSHLIDRLMRLKEEVICIDNFFTGSEENIKYWEKNPRFKIIKHDVINPIYFEVDKIWHLACSASPKIYSKNPIKTSKANYLGTYNMLELAKKTNAKILLASTSEIYGEPEVHPQPETYYGSVNNISKRSCYIEGKRIAESLCFDYFREFNTNIKIARIFNTYGPRMSVLDGRVISNFIVQTLKNNPITIYRDGSQTRSFCYVDDLIEGLILLMNSNIQGPINLGNPKELKIIDLAKKISLKINPNVKFIKNKLPQDDPKRRQPNIDLAISKLKWIPKISINDGLDKTIFYFKTTLKKNYN